MDGIEAVAVVPRKGRLRGLGVCRCAGGETWEEEDAEEDETAEPGYMGGVVPVPVALLNRGGGGENREDP